MVRNDSKENELKKKGKKLGGKPIGPSASSILNVVGGKSGPGSGSSFGQLDQHQSSAQKHGLGLKKENEEEDSSNTNVGIALKQRQGQRGLSGRELGKRRGIRGRSSFTPALANAPKAAPKAASKPFKSIHQGGSPMVNDFVMSHNFKKGGISKEARRKHLQKLASKK